MSAGTRDPVACEVIHGGEATFPPVVTLDMFGREYPLMHGGGICVAESDNNRGVIVAIGHPEFDAGFYIGLSPAQARSAAAWLLNAAQAIDGGGSRQ